jgi:hypothetical protein
MGNTFTVEVWKQRDWDGGNYGYEDFWRGENIVVALWKFWMAKREGHGCVTLHWR